MIGGGYYKGFDIYRSKFPSAAQKGGKLVSQRIYFDHNAGSPVRSSAMEAAIAAMRAGGNPSSVHQEGRRARRVVESARRSVAALVEASPKTVIFTAGATEANVTALTPEWHVRGQSVRFERLFVSAVEHPSVMRGGRFPAEAVEILPVDGQGIVQLGRLAQRLSECAPSLVSLQRANSETGVLQPVAEVATLVHAAGGRLHCDAVQAAGRIALEINELGADTIALSSHKIGGLQGCGALIWANPDVGPRPLVSGGGQELYRRAGTEAVPAIASFGAAADEALHDMRKIETLRAYRDWLIDALRFISPDMTVFGEYADRLANTICVAVPGIAAETAVIAFDLAGVAVSAGSACSSGKVTASHVLSAMGVPSDLSRGGIRISLGWTNTEDEVHRFVDVWRDVIGRMRTTTGRAA